MATRKLGDFNNDGIYDVRDASDVLSYAGKRSLGQQTPPITDEDFWAGDVDKNGILDRNDSSHILLAYAIASASGPFQHSPLEDIIVLAP